MSRFQLRRAHAVVAAAVVLVSLACSKSDAPPADTTAKAPDSAAAAAAVAPQPLVGGPAQALRRQRKTLPGDLTKPIDDYTGDEFMRLTRRLAYAGGHERQRRCRNDPGCSGARRTLVLVDAIATQDSISAGTTPEFGVIYVRAINRGDAPEARYGMLPHNKQYEYYMIISADSAGTGMVWRMEQLDTQARTHSKFGEGKFIGCNHKWVAGAQADFKTCANSAAGRDSILKLGLNLQGGDGDPIWATCGMGCCIGG